MENRFVVIVFMLVAVLSLGGTARAEMVAHWTFDSDWTADDPTYNFTPANGASITAGNVKIGTGAASFNRLTSQYAQTSASPFTLGSYSYVAWYYLDIADITNTTDRYFVLEATDTLRATYPASFGLRDLTPLGTPDDAQVYTSTSVATPAYFNLSAGSNQQWHHIAVTYDVTTGVFNGYLDGSLVGTMTNTGVLKVTDLLVIGGHRGTVAAPGTGRNWHGQIDDLGVFDNVISTDLISYLAAGNPVPEPATILLLGLGGLSLLRKRKT